MKTIIVCTDFSQEAENATHYAASMAKENTYRIILFSLQTVSVHALNAQASADFFYAQTLKNQKKLEDKAAELKRLYTVETQHHLASGNFIEELENCMQLHECDFVVMGMAEKTLEQKLLGNKVTRAIHRIKKPILIVPAHIEYTGIRKILFAYDTHKSMTWSAMNDIYYFINEFNAEVEVFNVSERLEDFTEVIHDMDLNSGYDLEDIKYSFKMIQSIEVIKAIEEEIRLTSPDLLTMVPYKYNLVESLFHRSKTAIMAYKNKIPLLSIPLNID
ncbi:nucleotide-binding universal stress UspA family protein [Chryseobacterium bernardetii]|uniref:Nucleotide-binding universal stress UspA family protein n=3 Tax=Chryseobacterium TaxID=59732 RepID=A0A543EBL6_9FLAO|nr:MULTISPECIES: universal stress protein [Chryseobacterium]MDR6371397.1 nucleotide-binding universal stress UspA family protein [Chryseobacterium vietnamense]MDR6442098.1 nucleotide-binding universal stress UspA family protein [Chryseobacterium bernardetii]MDR6459906.1 nucleotide-binding universal stress UspA family protein [Chryseobacterium vietnamense]TQM18977.1 nucleotide-binding universal stress UspA family protein [Chryseobacterium aquifrigidense]